MSATTNLPNHRMTAEAFIEWSMVQPEGHHYELVDGEVVGMASERVSHALMKGLVYIRLVEAVRRAGLPCTVFPDGMAVRIDSTTVYEPDTQVRCGPPLDGNATLLHDPVIVVEVRSPSTGSLDAGLKLVDYFRLPSIRHYLIVRTEKPAIVHHFKDDRGDIASRIVREGPIRLDPPGLIVEGLFDPLV